MSGTFDNNPECACPLILVVDSSSYSSHKYYQLHSKSLRPPLSCYSSSVVLGAKKKFSNSRSAAPTNRWLSFLHHGTSRVQKKKKSTPNTQQPANQRASQPASQQQFIGRISARSSRSTDDPHLVTPVPNYRHTPFALHLPAPIKQNAVSLTPIKT